MKSSIAQILLLSSMNGFLELMQILRDMMYDLYKDMLDVIVII